MYNDLKIHLQLFQRLLIKSTHVVVICDRLELTTETRERQRESETEKMRLRKFYA